MGGAGQKGTGHSFDGDRQEAKRGFREGGGEGEEEELPGGGGHGAKAKYVAPSASERSFREGRFEGEEA